MPGTIDDRYFEWLYAKFGAVSNRNPAHSYWNLFRQLYSREFVWFVPNDDNRVEDGKELRRDFIDEQGTDGVDANWLGLGCSVLEMLVALAGRASFETSREPGEWIWQFLNNLNFDEYNDAAWHKYCASRITRALDTFVFRTYSPTGIGGVFPLRAATEDQRKVELWYQMSAYLLENNQY